MAIPTAKLLKIGGPALTGVGGVFATSSLVSKSADEKPEEKLKTSALKDEEPPIEEYEDANEGECKKTKDNPCNGGQKPTSGSKGEKGDRGAQGSEGDGGQPASQQGGETQTDSGFPQGPEGDNEKEGQEESGAKEEGTETSSPEGGGDDSDDSDDENGEGVTEDGAENAQHNHASGTAYGTEDKAMTLQDLERTKQTKSDLENLKSQLLGLIGT